VHKKSLGSGDPATASTVTLMGRAAHWEDRYRTTGATAVSWYEERPSTSLHLLGILDVRPNVAIIDVGGGASTLVDHLVQAGYADVTVLDVSAVALDAARARLGGTSSVTWIHRDLLTWSPPRRWGAWHDRAVLHFLVDDHDRATYASLLRSALEPGGAFVIGTFAEDGPTDCSALPVRRYSARDLVEFLGNIDLVEQRREVHRTPNGTDQPFNWIAGRLRPES